VRVRVVGEGARPVARVTVTWTAGAGGSATPASSVTDRDGVASTSWRLGGTAGSQELTASVVGGRVSGVLVATATAGRAASVRVAGDTVLSLVPGVTVALGAVALDRFGNVLTTPVSWTSADGAVATVDATGRLVTRAPGTVVLQAVSDTARARVTVRVAAQSSLSVTRVSPETLVPGGTLVIEGAGFGEGAAAAQVRVAGVTAAIVEATPTRIRATVPALDALPCIGTEGGAVTVLRQSATGATDSVRTAVALPTTATRRSLRVGESVALLTASDARCTQLDGGGRYIVSVFNTDDSGDRSGARAAARDARTQHAGRSCAARAVAGPPRRARDLARAVGRGRARRTGRRRASRAAGVGARAAAPHRLPARRPCAPSARAGSGAAFRSSGARGARSTRAAALGVDRIGGGGGHRRHGLDRRLRLPGGRLRETADRRCAHASSTWAGRRCSTRTSRTPNAGRVDAVYRQVGARSTT
jgi:hypothetical protein